MSAAIEQPLVSVVTPVYNGEAHLRACIESVLGQTYRNWDHTIVDNCSTDGTLAIASEYAAKDPRVRVRTNNAFVRVIPNYNNAVGSVSAESKYCKVVAADDWLDAECLEKMVGLAENYPNVAIVGAYGLKGRKVMWTGLPYSDTVVNGPTLCRARLLGEPYIFGTPTTVLYRADLVRARPRFYNESNFHADSEVCLQLLEHGDFGFVHQILTRQGERDDSLSQLSNRVHTYLPWVLYELVTYGPKFLGIEATHRRIREQLHNYYRYLGQQAYRRRGREFWDYHRRKLAELGYPLSRTRLIYAATMYLLDVLLNPKSTLDSLARRLSGRSAAED